MDEARQLAHDVRAAIHAARMAATMLRKQVDGPAMDALDDALAEAAALVRPDQPGPADLQRITQEVVASFEAHARGIAATVEVGPLPVVAASPQRARRVMQNLVSNALTYGGHGVHVHIYSDAGIHVVDNGPGFEADVPSAGEGRGLAACREWLTLDGGSLALMGGPGGHVVVTWPEGLVEAKEGA